MRQPSNAASRYLCNSDVAFHVRSAATALLHCSTLHSRTSANSVTASQGHLLCRLISIPHTLIFVPFPLFAHLAFSHAPLRSLPAVTSDHGHGCTVFLLRRLGALDSGNIFGARFSNESRRFRRKIAEVHPLCSVSCGAACVERWVWVGENSTALFFFLF